MKVASTVAAGVLATGVIVASVWTGGADLDRTKQIIDDMVGKITVLHDSKESLETQKAELEQQKAELEARLAELDQKNKDNEGKAGGMKGELEKANAEVEKANQDAKELKDYAEQKLEEVNAIVNE